MRSISLSSLCVPCFLFTMGVFASSILSSESIVSVRPFMFGGTSSKTETSGREMKHVDNDSKDNEGL